MSTKIKEMKGRKETNNTFGYTDSFLSLTRFSGGKEMGRMLQLTVYDDNRATYIQLTQEQVKELAITLSEAFDDTIYPSE
jgi:hypothetical protein